MDIDSAEWNAPSRFKRGMSEVITDENTLSSLSTFQPPQKKQSIHYGEDGSFIYIPSLPSIATNDWVVRQNASFTLETVCLDVFQCIANYLVERNDVLGLLLTGNRRIQFGVGQFVTALSTDAIPLQSLTPHLSNLIRLSIVTTDKRHSSPMQKPIVELKAFPFQRLQHVKLVVPLIPSAKLLGAFPTNIRSIHLGCIKQWNRHEFRLDSSIFSPFTSLETLFLSPFTDTLRGGLYDDEEVTYNPISLQMLNLNALPQSLTKLTLIGTLTIIEDQYGRLPQGVQSLTANYIVGEAKMLPKHLKHLHPRKKSHLTGWEHAPFVKLPTIEVSTWVLSQCAVTGYSGFPSNAEEVIVYQPRQGTPLSYPHYIRAFPALKKLTLVPYYKPLSDTSHIGPPRSEMLPATSKYPATLETLELVGTTLDDVVANTQLPTTITSLIVKTLLLKCVGVRDLLLNRTPMLRRLECNTSSLSPISCFLLKRRRPGPMENIPLELIEHDHCLSAVK